MLNIYVAGFFSFFVSQAIIYASKFDFFFLVRIRCCNKSKSINPQRYENIHSENNSFLNLPINLICFKKKIKWRNPSDRQKPWML